MEYDIFISYSRKDLEQVKAIKSKIELATGAKCWMDLEGIESGAPRFTKAIIDGIEQSQVFLFMRSAQSQASKYALLELNYANDDVSGNHVVIVNIDDSKMTKEFSFLYKLTDTINWNDLPQREKLFRDIRRWIGKLEEECIRPYINAQANTHQINTILSQSIEIHIDTDTDCNIYRFNEYLGSVKAGEDGIINLIPGNHRLRFVSEQYSEIEYVIKKYNVPTSTFSDIIEVKLKEQVYALEQKIEEERKKTEAEKWSEIGKDYYLGNNGKSQDYAEAVKWYRKAAEQGNTNAQNNLGVCYETGQGVTKNLKEAIRWYMKAAEQGNMNAQNNLGLCYKSGQGVTKDLKEAVKWFCKAAEQGNANAQNNLGVCYENGQGVSQDYVEAIKWYKKAAEQGNRFAILNLKDLHIGE